MIALSCTDLHHSAAIILNGGQLRCLDGAEDLLPLAGAPRVACGPCRGKPQGHAGLAGPRRRLAIGHVAPFCYLQTACPSGLSVSRNLCFDNQNNCLTSDLGYLLRCVPCNVVLLPNTDLQVGIETQQLPFFTDKSRWSWTRGSIQGLLKSGFRSD